MMVPYTAPRVLQDLYNPLAVPVLYLPFISHHFLQYHLLHHLSAAAIVHSKSSQFTYLYLILQYV